MQFLLISPPTSSVGPFVRASLNRFQRALATAALISFPATWSHAAVSFTADIAPLLRDRCVTCHRAEKSKGKYRLDTFARLLEPGRSGLPPVLPGRPQESEWIRLCRATDPDDRMPQDAEPLTHAEVHLLEQWIKEGAAFDGTQRETDWAGQLGAAAYPSAPASYARPLPVTALAFSTNGQELFSSGFQEVLVWDVTSRRLLRRLDRQPQRILALDVHPREAWLLVAGGEPGRRGDLRIVQTGTGETVRVLATESDVFLAAAFSPDGNHVAGGGADNSVSIFETRTGRREHRLAVCADWVMSLAWSPDGQRLAVASRDRTARVLDAATGEGITSFTAHAASVNALAFTADGEKIVSAGRNASVWRWSSGDAEKKDSLGPVGAEILALRATSEGFFTAGTDGRLRYQAFPEPKTLIPYEADAGRLNTLAVHAGNRRLAAGGHDGRIWLWEIGQLQPATTWFAKP